MADIRHARTVCFTGRAVVDGEHLIRSKLEWLANQADLRIVALDGINWDTVLVAANLGSQSRKAQKARDYGCAIVTPAEFVAHCRTFDGRQVA